MTKRQAYWLQLKISHPDEYEKLDLAYRKKHRGKIRQRARDWNRDNKARRNIQRKKRYALLKEK